MKDDLSEDLDLDAIEASAERAYMCQSEDPADCMDDRCKAIATVHTLVDAYRKLAAENERLADWKESAMAVLAQWDDVWEALGRPGPLGSIKSVAAKIEVERLTRERDEARAENESLRRALRDARLIKASDDEKLEQRGYQRATDDVVAYLESEINGILPLYPEHVAERVAILNRLEVIERGEHVGSSGTPAVSLAASEGASGVREGDTPQPEPCGYRDHDFGTNKPIVCAKAKGHGGAHGSWQDTPQPEPPKPRRRMRGNPGAPDSYHAKEHDEVLSAEDAEDGEDLTAEDFCSADPPCTPVAADTEEASDAES